MIKKGQHTAKLTAFFAGILILAHVVVPHHHHFDFLFSHHEDEACESTGHESPGENPDAHCHAFNVIVSEKSNEDPSKLSVADYFIPGFFKIEEKETVSLAENVIGRVFCYHVPLREQLFLSNRFLRAPPSTI